MPVVVLKETIGTCSNFFYFHYVLPVSVGGTTGLFVGASLLSFVELVIYFTVRFAINIWLERQEITNKVVIRNDDEELSNDDILIVVHNRNQGLGYLNGSLHLHDQSDY